MLELLLIITFVGLIWSSSRKMRIGNPFQLYFLIWFIIFSLCLVTHETYDSISSVFWGLLVVVKLFAIFIFFSIYITHKGFSNKEIPINISKSTDRLLLFAQIIVTVALPFAYFYIIRLTDGEDIFSIQGYIQLRRALTEGIDGVESMWLFKYLPNLSYIVSSITTFCYLQRNTNFGRLAASVLVSLSYIYLSSGRTYILFLMCAIAIPLVITGILRLKGILIAALIFASLFIFIAVMTEKGILVNNEIIDNIEYFHEYMKGYTIFPLAAFSKLVESAPDIDWGMNIFRFITAFSYRLGFTDTPPVPLIRDYLFSDVLTNVYTVYEVYFRDFSYFGMMIPPAFLIVHYWLYYKAMRFGGVWMFYYSVSVYALLIQFFQDQYFSIFSTWIQTIFWYWFFLVLPEFRLSISDLRLSNGRQHMNIEKVKTQ